MRHLSFHRARVPLSIACQLAVGLLAVGSMPAAAEPRPFPPRESHVWPVSGTVTPDLPFSSTFGPRLKASESFRYDWHRGVDLPVPCNTPLHAIRAGVVRMAGDYPGVYADRMLQICHPRPGAPASVCGVDADNDGLMDDADHDGRVDGAVSAQAYYSVYLHLAGTAVVVGQQVVAGEVVAHSGDSAIAYSGACQPGNVAGGYDHLHFELRDGGVTSAQTVHPLLVLPHLNPGAPSVTFTSVDLAQPGAPVVEAEIATPAGDADFNRLELRVFDHSGGSPLLVASKTLDLMAWTALHSADVATLDTAPGYTGQYLDSAVFGANAGITVMPEVFSAAASQYRLRVRFAQLAGGADAAQLSFELRAFDIDGLVASAVQGPAAGPGGGAGGGGGAVLPVPLLAPGALIGLAALLGFAAALRPRRGEPRGN